jgi:hypothetical protein
MVTRKKKYNAGSRSKRVVLKTQVPNTQETLHCEDPILPSDQGYEN